MKVFSKKNNIEKQIDEQQLLENKDNNPSLSVPENKKTGVDKKKVKEEKKAEAKIPVKKKMKEVVHTITNTENGGTTSFKRNLRPRRSSTMLDDYIMTDSEEDSETCEPESEENKYETPKSLSKITLVGDSKVQKIKSSAEESDKKNLKMNKTDLKLKKDLNKIDSEVKKSLSETKSKSILLKCNKELEIKNSKNTAVDKKTEKSSKHKTEIVAINKEPKNVIGGSKNTGKKVPLLNKQQSTKKEIASNMKKSKLDLYNNNNKKIKSTSSSVESSSSSMYSSITSQTKEELLEHMAAIFDAKSTASENVEKIANNVAATITSENNSITTEKKVENSTMKKKLENSALEKKVDSNTMKKSAESIAVGKRAECSSLKKKSENSAVKKKVESSITNKKVENSAMEKKAESNLNKNSSGNSAVIEKKIDNNEAKAVNNKLIQCKQELKKVSKTENIVAVTKEENVTAEKVENDVKIVDKVEKIESLVPLNKVEKVENIITFAKDLFLGQQKEIKITMPEYFTDKNFQLPNRFKPDDGLSVLSEICSTLPRFNEPFVSNRQLLNKLPPSGESSFVKYTSLSSNGDEKKEEKSQTQALVPPSFESRTMKMVNLARSNNTVATTTNKKDLTASWRQAFKNVKLSKNGLASTAVSVGNNLMSWTKKKQNNIQCQTPKTDSVDGGKSKETVSSNDLMNNSNQLPLVNGTMEKKSESYLCQKTSGESKSTEMVDGKKVAAAASNASYLAKTTILNSTKYDLKFEKRASSISTSASTTVFGVEKQQQQRKEVIGDVSSSDDLSPEKKIFHQRRLSTNQSCSGNSSDAFSPDNETSVYAFQPDLPEASTPFRRNKPQSPAKSRTVSPNTSIAVSILDFLLLFGKFNHTKTCFIQCFFDFLNN